MARDHVREILVPENSYRQRSSGHFQFVLLPASARDRAQLLF